jgi:hypothetical protein
MTETISGTKEGKVKERKGGKKASKRTDPNEPKKGLGDLARQIREGHRACLDSVRSTIDHAAKAGQLLIRAKKEVEHGEWLDWLRKECGISDRVAQNYTRIARNYERIKELADQHEDLTIRQALDLIGRKDADRSREGAKAPAEVFRVTPDVAARKARDVRSFDRGMRSRIEADQEFNDFLAARQKMIYESVRREAVKLAKALARESGPDGVYQVAFTLVSQLKERLDFSELFLTDEPASPAPQATAEPPATTPDAAAAANGPLGRSP